MPIYFVVWENVYHPQYQVRMIRHVIETDLKEINSLWDKYVIPLQRDARQIGVDFYLREVSNPFKDFTSESQQSNLPSEP